MEPCICLHCKNLYSQYLACTAYHMVQSYFFKRGSRDRIMATLSTKWNRFHYLIVDDLVISVKVLHGVEKCHCQRRSKFGILTSLLSAETSKCYVDWRCSIVATWGCSCIIATYFRGLLLCQLWAISNMNMLSETSHSYRNRPRCRGWGLDNLRTLNSDVGVPPSPSP